MPQILHPETFKWAYFDSKVAHKDYIAALLRYSAGPVPKLFVPFIYFGFKICKHEVYKDRNSPLTSLLTWFLVWIQLSDFFCFAGPDVESFTTEISLQVPTQAELRHKLSSLSSTCTDSASQDTEAGEEDYEDEDEETEQGGGGGGAVGGTGGGGRRRRPPVVVTLDEEEVHPDTALVDREDQTSKDCDESRPKVWGGMDWI